MTNSSTQNENAPGNLIQIITRQLALQQESLEHWQKLGVELARQLEDAGHNIAFYEGQVTALTAVLATLQAQQGEEQGDIPFTAPFAKRK